MSASTSVVLAFAIRVSAVTWVVLAVALPLIVFFGVLLVRQDRHRRHRPHPRPEEGGRSFGDTTHWGGFGRPGT
jgi:hypothetical protein